MQGEESRLERVQRFSRIWWKSRNDAGKSQEYMALSLGVSRKTVQNWEKGASSPNLFQGFEWFDLLGLNPTAYYLGFLYPGLFEQLSPETDDETIEQILMEFIKQFTPLEKRQLLFLIAGEHGSSWHSLLQLFTAHCHTCTRSRLSAARVIKENYDMESASGELVCPDNVQPELDMLEHAICRAKQSVSKRPGDNTAAKPSAYHDILK